MTRYIALLRGINVGGHQRIAMADLRALLAGAGYTAVRTHLQSGNAVLTAASDVDADRVAAEVEAAIARELGLTVPVVVRTAAELAGVVSRNPLTVTDPARFLVTFLSAAPDVRLLSGIDAAAYAPAEFAIGDRELYFSLPDGLRNAKLPDLVGRRLGGLTATARNWNTVTRLLAMARE